MHLHNTDFDGGLGLHSVPQEFIVLYLTFKLKGGSYYDHHSATLPVILVTIIHSPLSNKAFNQFSILT